MSRRGWRRVGACLLGVGAVDGALLLVAFHSAFAGAGALLLGALALVVWPGSGRLSPVLPGGWVLGPAQELTDPDHPTAGTAVLSDQALNLGFLVLGAPGSGKTESVELGLLFALPKASGWSYFEGKGDLDIYKKCCSMGRTPDHFFSSELPGSESVNLLAGAAPDVVDRLTKVLVGETRSTSFYSDEQRAVLTRIVPLLLGLGAPANLRDLYAVLTVDDAGHELVRRARAAGLDPTLVTLVQTWLAIPQPKRLQSIAGLLNRLFVFVHGPTTDRLNAYRPQIDIARIVREQRSLYLHLPFTRFARDVAIALVEMFGVEARHRQLAGAEGLARFPLILDDWGGFFHEDFGSFSARCRSAAMPLFFGFQSRAQLESVSPVYANELDDTIATKIILRIQGDATAEYAGRLLGQYEAPTISTSHLGERAGSALGYSWRPRLDGRALRSLAPGEAYVSTIAPEGLRNPLWRVRFPRPPFGAWQQVALPPARPEAPGEGLGFWDRYLNPAALRAVHLAVVAAEAQRADTHSLTTSEQRAAEAQRLADNPGLPS